MELIRMGFRAIITQTGINVLNVYHGHNTPSIPKD